MAYRRTLTEALHLVAGLVATAAIFRAGAWSYPQGRDTIIMVGVLTMLAVAAMSVPELAKAWGEDRTGDGPSSRRPL